MRLVRYDQWREKTFGASFTRGVQWMKDHGESLETKAVHAGEPRPGILGAVTMPVFQSSTYECPEGGEKVRYLRLNNTPNQVAVAEKIAALEGAEAGLVGGSGMAIISSTLLSFIPEGGHLLAQEGLYGGTLHFLHEGFPSLGRSVSYFSVDKWDGVQLHPKTKAIYVESISNPLLRVADFKSIVSFAKKRGLISIIDNTFTSPVNFNPLELGFDLVVHSATKYLNGHSDIAGGVVVGSHSLIKKVAHLMEQLGGCLDAHSCFLLNRGLKTLPLRIRWQNESALKLARALSGKKKVKTVIYPGLEDHPDHERAVELFRGFGGMLSFEFDGSVEQVDRFLSYLSIPFSAPSLGGAETLVTRPAVTTHRAFSKDELRQFGIGETLVRVSVGLENPDDLIGDFSAALDRVT